MTSQRVTLVLGIIFLIVGVVSVINTIRLQNYIRETVPRDTAQESCQLATLQALRVWSLGRAQIEDAKTARDEAFRPVFDAALHGQKASPEIVARLDREYANVETVKQNVKALLDASPIPKCQLYLGGG